MMRREPAWRILSGEFNMTRFVIKSDNSKQPSYILTPLGAMINRVFIVGEAIDMEDLGDDSNSFYKIRVTDPTGVFHLAVGQYQPAALKALHNIKIPSYIAVIGKVKSFEPESGGLYLSVRPEFIYPSTPEQRAYWLYEVSRSLKSRLEAVSEAQQMSDPTIDQIKSLGYSSMVARGITNALEKYDMVSLEPFQTFLKDTLQFLVEGNGKDNLNGTDTKELQGISTSKGTEKVLTKPSAKTKAENDNIEIEKKILKILETGPNKRKHGINWNELLQEVSKLGIERRLAENTVRDLMDKGVVYEPILGVLKKI